MATADKLNRLKQTKADLKAALTEKGQNPGNVFSQYPDMVRAIQTGGEQATPEIEVSDSGLITATAGDKSATKQLSTQIGKTITPGAEEQIAVAAGKYVTGDVIVAAVESTGGGSSGPFAKVSVMEGPDGEIVDIPVNIKTAVSVSWEKYYTHFLYNGVRLPRIPDSVLASYPYAWIRNDIANEKYDLVMSKTVNWLKGDGTAIRSDYETLGTYAKWFTTPTANPDAWAEQSHSYGGFTVNDSRPVLWSNHDIPNGSATATDIYFEGTEPVPTD